MDDVDLARRSAREVVVLTARGVLHGHGGVRESAGLLYQAIRDGVDSYLIEDGRIVAQTIHYTVVSRELSVGDLANPSHQAEETKG